MFFEYLKAYRADSGLSQTELSELSGVSQQGISNIESGTRSPTEATMRLLAKALGHTVAEMVVDPQDDVVTVDSLSADERGFLALYRSLNADGRAQAENMLRLIAGNPDMVKDAAQAAPAV